MGLMKYSIDQQGRGHFNNGEIIENKPLGFPQDGGLVKPYSNLFYWAKASAVKDSTIGLHPHQGFEIMSFVLKGKIRHFDNKQNKWIDIDEGGAQLIKSGNGISHAEHLTKDAVMFQIWFDPNLEKTIRQGASYVDVSADDLHTESSDSMMTINYVDEKSKLQLDAPELSIRKYLVKDTNTFELDQSKIYSIYVIKGYPLIDASISKPDDFFILENESSLRVEGQCELFVIESPASLNYKTYSQLMGLEE